MEKDLKLIEEIINDYTNSRSLDLENSTYFSQKLYEKEKAKISKEFWDAIEALDRIKEKCGNKE